MSVKERLIRFIAHKGLSKSAFCRTIGVSNAFVTSIVRSIQPDKVQRIASNFPELNIAWLLTGEGEMLNDPPASPVESPSTTGKVIPYFDAEVAAGTAYGVDMTPGSRPTGMIEIGSLMKDSQFALRVYGNSMAPNYPAGCVVGLRQHQDRFIEPGTVYVVETVDNRYLKRLYYNGDKTAFRCISDNMIQHASGSMAGEYFYPEFEIPLQDVRRIFQITGVITRTGM